MDKLKIAIISPASDGRLREVISALSAGGAENAGVFAPEVTVEKLASAGADAALILGPGDAAFAAAERIYSSLPGCPAVMLCAETDAETAGKALNAGVRRLIVWPGESETLTETLAYTVGEEKRRAAAASVKPGAAKPAEVITVFGTKGGIGKTTVAVNIATALALSGRRVALIDLDLQFGDVGVFLDLSPAETIADLASMKKDINIAAVNDCMQKHSSGISVLCAPRSPEYAELVTPGHIERIIAALRPHYDYIIADTAPVYNDNTLTAIESASLVLFLIVLDISTLRNARLSMNLFESLGHQDKINLLVNREVEGIITARDAEKIMGKKLLGRLPSDWKSATNALNKGVPLVINAPGSVLSRTLTGLAGTLAAQCGDTTGFSKKAVRIKA